MADMSEQEASGAGAGIMNTQGPPALPPPDPQYEPAKTDSRIIVRFFGNTPEVAEMQFMGCSPGHLWACAERLAYEADKMQKLADYKQSQMGIKTAGAMPPSGFVRP